MVPSTFYSMCTNYYMENNNIVRNFLLENFCKDCNFTRCGSCKKYQKELRSIAFKWLNDNYHIYDLYKENSALRVAAILNCKYNTNFFNNNNIMDIMLECGYKLHSIKEATNFKSTRELSKKTCLERFGAINPLSKNTEAYKKRNKTVKSKYGVDNVFQIKEVKEKIVKSTFNHFGCYSQAAPEVYEKTKKTMYEKYGAWAFNTENAVEKSKLANIGNSHWVSKPDLVVQNFLKSQNIYFEAEKTFYNKDLHKWAIVDILVGNIAFEVQGTYWHADPRKYNANDIVHHEMTAKEIWQKDENRKHFLESYNLKVIYLWQEDILSNFDNIKDIILKEVENAF